MKRIVLKIKNEQGLHARPQLNSLKLLITLMAK